MTRISLTSFTDVSMWASNLIWRNWNLESQRSPSWDTLPPRMAWKSQRHLWHDQTYQLYRAQNVHWNRELLREVYTPSVGNPPTPDIPLVQGCVLDLVLCPAGCLWEGQRPGYNCSDACVLQPWKGTDPWMWRKWVWPGAGGSSLPRRKAPGLCESHPKWPWAKICTDWERDASCRLWLDQVSSLHIWTGRPCNLWPQAPRVHREEAPSKAPRRIQNRLLQAQYYSYSLEYRAGKDIPVADTLSRAPIQDKQNIGNKIFHVFYTPLSCDRLRQVRAATSADAECVELKNTILTGWPQSNQEVQRARVLASPKFLTHRQWPLLKPNKTYRPQSPKKVIMYIIYIYVILCIC